MAQKIKAGAVSYLNTKPLIYGFEQGMMNDEVELVIDYPSQIAKMLINKEIDLGLVPLAVITDLSEYHIIADYGIACDGEVASVCLFSDVPLASIETIYLDYQSRTSVALLKILLEEHWKIQPRLIDAGVDFEEHISGTTAGLVIGDRALLRRPKSHYIFDLGTAWKEMTGMPFVFAAWISNTPMPEYFRDNFNRANELGLLHLDTVISQNPFPAYDLKHYYTQNIQYRLDAPQYQAIEIFVNKLKRHPKAIL